MLLLTTNAQDDKKLIYTLTESGIYVVTPNFDQVKSDIDPCPVQFTDDNLANQLFYNVIKEVFNNEQLNSIRLSNTFSIDFNSKGEVLYCRFFIDKHDKTLISEDNLYNLYVKLKKLKIDMSKVEFIRPYSSYICDYGEYFGVLQPMEYRSKWLKK